MNLSPVYRERVESAVSILQIVARDLKIQSVRSVLLKMLSRLDSVQTSEELVPIIMDLSDLVGSMKLAGLSDYANAVKGANFVLRAIWEVTG